MKPLFLALKVHLHNYDSIQTDFSFILKGRWVAAENLHVTLNYFGNRYSVDELLEKLPQFLDEVEPLNLIGLDCFEKNKIIYVKSESNGLAAIHNSINKYFALDETRAFIPHVTLMRFKSIANKEEFKKKLLVYKNKELGDVESTFHLMQSTRTSEGSLYECVKSF